MPGDFIRLALFATLAHYCNLPRAEFPLYLKEIASPVLSFRFATVPHICPVLADVGLSSISL
jgi:hypothetical protein